MKKTASVIFGILLLAALLIITRGTKPESLAYYEGTSGALKLLIPLERAPFKPTPTPGFPEDRWVAFSFLYRVPTLDAEARARTKNFKPPFVRSDPYQLLALAREAPLDESSFDLSTLSGVNEGEKSAGCSFIDTLKTTYGLNEFKLTCPPHSNRPLQLAKSLYLGRDLMSNEQLVIRCQGEQAQRDQGALKVCTLTVARSGDGLHLRTSFAFADLRYWREIKSALLTTLNGLSKQ